MAGRGCTITIKLLGGASGEGETEDITLPVALHSPLDVLKDQLHQLVQIQPADQVLILLDLDDPDRNSDVLLTGRDFQSLREIGIRNGSILSLHALGMSAEKQQLMMKEVLSGGSEQKDLEVIHTLDTRVSAAEADHRYVIRPFQ